LESMQRLNDWVSDTDASELSRELRLDQGEYLPQRRRVAGLALVSLGMMGIISLYQMGVIRLLLPDRHRRHLRRSPGGGPGGAGSVEESEPVAERRAASG
jgi:hypothetical protein